MAAEQNILKHAKGLINYINRSPSPFHAVNATRERLLGSGFREILEEDTWSLKPNDKVFLTRNESTLVAMTIGGQYKPGNGFAIVGAHTDSPCLKVKPLSENTKDGYIQLGVQTYGGGLWYTWFDRDLTVAGRCITRSSSGLQHHLVNIKRPILRVPSLAIHLNRTANDGFAPNKETHLAPLLCTTVKEHLLYPETTCSTATQASTKRCHPSSLLRLIASELNVNADDIVDIELCLADSQPSAIGGIHEEFIFAPRLDNLFNSYACIEGMIEALDSLETEKTVRVACLYDNEEVGSESAQGAASSITELVLRRICNSVKVEGGPIGGSPYEESIVKSYLLSADQAHAVHPNYDDKHDKNHRPKLHAGIVLKQNVQQRYATTAITSAILKEIAAKANVPLQEFCVRQDMACGSTIGPIMSAKLGIPTIDVGGPMLSMHSCREMCCTTSVSQATQLFKAFYEKFESTRSNMKFN